MNAQTLISQSSTPRDTVEIQLPDHRVLSGPRFTRLETFFQVLPDWNQIPIMGAIVNNELRELTYPIKMDALVQPVTMADPDGARIYRRSLTFLLEIAFEDLFPDVVLSIDHSLTSGGFFCHVRGRPPLSCEELQSLEKRMHELVQANLPLERQEVPLSEAVEFFRKKGYEDKVKLIEYRQKSFLALYQVGEHRDYHHGYMVPSTGYLKWFALMPMGDGFALRFPRRQNTAELLPMPESSSLLATFRQYREWLSRLNVDTVGSLNEAIRADRIREIILVSEALHELKIAEIASQIAARQQRVRVVLIAGPSSSGKTTFSKRLAVQLLAQGISPFPLEMDNYFVDREKTPRDALGQYDYETLEALDTALLSEHLQHLIAGDEVRIPSYSFILGRSEPGPVIRLQRDQIIILEGIHGLNPRLIPEIPVESTFRIYISSLTALNLDRHNRISTTDTRLIRRIVRDARERGYSAQQNIQRWESVRRGEERQIFPYQDYADEMFNSALVYEMSALKPMAEPLLRQVPFGTPEYIEAKRLLAFLEWFMPVDEEWIPDNSILREFIGSSILRDFKF